jgi:hypothetical protein
MQDSGQTRKKDFDLVEEFCTGLLLWKLPWNLPTCNVNEGKGIKNIFYSKGQRFLQLVMYIKLCYFYLHVILNTAAVWDQGYLNAAALWDWGT